MKTVKEIKTALENSTARSAWQRGVRDYAIDMFDEYVEGHKLQPDSIVEEVIKSDFLNGAENWEAYSYDGCALVYDYDICTALCPPSMQKRLEYGDKQPNNYETWLDIQAKALKQAYALIRRIIR